MTKDTLYDPDGTNAKELAKLKKEFFARAGRNMKNLTKFHSNWSTP